MRKETKKNSVQKAPPPFFTASIFNPEQSVHKFADLFFLFFAQILVCFQEITLFCLANQQTGVFFDTLRV
jgi:hypothetical protein